MESPCGPGDATGSSTGVTDTEITVTGFSDSGGQVGGLNKGIDDASLAFVEWCNGQGGINGRQIKLEHRDAALFNYTNDVVAPACEDSLALVGGLAVFDDAGAQSQVDCGLPNVPAAAVSSMQAGADLTYMPNPSPPNQLMVGMATELLKRHPDAAQKAGIVHGDVASLEYIQTRMMEALTSIGYTFVWDETAAIGESNWPPLVVGMQRAGVRYLVPVSAWEEVVNLEAAEEQQGFAPEVTALETNFYQANYPAQSGGNADGNYVQLTTWPFGEADQNPAMEEFLAALEAAVPGVAPEQLGVLSWSAWLMWAQAAKNAGSDLTRETLVTELGKITSWDGGGLHGTSDPAANEPSPCFILMQIEDESFKRVFPTEADDAAIYEEGQGFSCNPDYIVDLTTNFDNGAKVGG